MGRGADGPAAHIPPGPGIAVYSQAPGVNRVAPWPVLFIEGRHRRASTPGGRHHARVRGPDEAPTWTLAHRANPWLTFFLGRVGRVSGRAGVRRRQGRGDGWGTGTSGRAPPASVRTRPV
jgi:hypothetical protein